MNEGLEFLKDALEVSERSIKIANEIVQYSDQIAQLLHRMTHSKLRNVNMPHLIMLDSLFLEIATPKKQQGWASDLNNFDISDQKILSFSKLIISIYKDSPRTIYPRNVRHIFIFQYIKCKFIGSSERYLRKGLLP